MTCRSVECRNNLICSLAYKTQCLSYERVGTNRRPSFSTASDVFGTERVDRRSKPQSPIRVGWCLVN
jgi:hypothetical protein